MRRACCVCCCGCLVWAAGSRPCLVGGQGHCVTTGMQHAAAPRWVIVRVLSGVKMACNPFFFAQRNSRSCEPAECQARGTSQAPQASIGHKLWPTTLAWDPRRLPRPCHCALFVWLATRSSSLWCHCTVLHGIERPGGLPGTKFLHAEAWRCSLHPMMPERGVPQSNDTLLRRHPQPGP